MTSARAWIEQIYHAAIAAVDPRTCVNSALRTAPDGRVFVCDVPIESENDGVYLIALGKAGEAMANGAVDALGDLIRRGVVVTKEPAGGELFERFDYVVGSHPVPDERSLEAGETVLEFARNVPDRALIICLISGGGSALAEALRPGVSLAELREVTSQLLRGAAPIHDLNAVRARLSRIKAGGLLAALAHTRVVNLIVSDVLGDDLHAIASGPSVPPEPSASAEAVLERYGVRLRLPELERRSVRAPATSKIVANLARAIDAAAEEAESIGLRPVVLADRLTGEAREVGRSIGEILAGSRHRLSPFPPGSCLIAGGETTVTVRGDGTGGRNTEAALAAAIALEGMSGLTVGFLATDGDDGMSNAAGAIVDGATISSDAASSARKALEFNDSSSFLSGTGAIWRPGATGTNVNDLVIGIVE